MNGEVQYFAPSLLKGNNVFRKEMSESIFPLCCRWNSFIFGLFSALFIFSFVYILFFPFGIQYSFVAFPPNVLQTSHKLSLFPKKMRKSTPLCKEYRYRERKCIHYPLHHCCILGGDGAPPPAVSAGDVGQCREATRSRYTH